jgi:hypothetical protein
MMSFDKVKTFTNNLEPLFGHDANMKGFGLTPLFGDCRGCMPPQLKRKSKNASLKKIFPHREALAESVGFKSRMMSFDKVKTFTNNLGPLFGHDAINRKAVRLRAIERKYKKSRYFCIGSWFCGLFGGMK